MLSSWTEQFFRSVPTVDLGKCLEGSIINHSNFACRHNVLIYNHMQNLCKNIMAVFLKMNDHNITQYTTHKMMAILKMMTNAEYNYYYTECAFPPGTIQHVPLPNLLLEGSVALLQRQAGSQHSCCHFVTIVVITLLQRQAGCHWNHPIYRHIRCWHQHHCHFYHHQQYCKYCKPWQRPLWSQLKWTVIIIIIFACSLLIPPYRGPSPCLSSSLGIAYILIIILITSLQILQFFLRLFKRGGGGVLNNVKKPAG